MFSKIRYIIFQTTNNISSQNKTTFHQRTQHFTITLKSEQVTDDKP